MAYMYSLDWMIGKNVSKPKYSEVLTRLLGSVDNFLKMWNGFIDTNNMEYMTAHLRPLLHI